MTVGIVGMSRSADAPAPNTKTTFGNRMAIDEADATLGEVTQEQDHDGGDPEIEGIRAMLPSR